jgi:multisubunit Na+/H+ antiporter MnhG subunit
VTLRHVIATVLLIAGGSLQLLAIVGLLAMRNAYDRLHYLGLAGYGGLLIAVSILVKQNFSLLGDKALLTGALLAAFGPVLAHATARSLRIRERGDWRAGSDERPVREKQ